MDFLVLEGPALSNTALALPQGVALRSDETGERGRGS